MVLYDFQIGELQVLAKFLERQYLPYDDEPLHAVVNKIERIVKAHKDELDKQPGVSTPGDGIPS